MTQSEFLPQNLQQCFEKALRLEASLQLSEGVNMARKTMVMNVEVDASLKMLELDQMLATNVGKWDICSEIASMMEINPQMVGKNKEDHLILMIL